ncbi:hypothetical protein SDC9_136663 [bioreactor metagenome]|uniref:Uncharacterized protein n=1 Tax=bioreactor metagenome TaxID=1076179 RepID=A0A645DJC7_9ZZZZ
MGDPADTQRDRHPDDHLHHEPDLVPLYRHPLPDGDKTASVAGDRDAGDVLRLFGAGADMVPLFRPSAYLYVAAGVAAARAGSWGGHRRRAEVDTAAGARRLAAAGRASLPRRRAAPREAALTRRGA